VHSKIKFGLSIFAVTSLNLTVALAGTQQYTVKPGDSLYRIAGKYHTTVHAIDATNQLHSSMLHPGQKLLVPTQSSKPSKSVSVSPVKKTSNSGSVRIRTVTVKNGDTIWRLAQKHGVSVNDIESWNHLDSTTLHAGQTLIVTGLHKSSSSKLSSRDGGSPDATVSQAALGYTVAQYAAHYLGVPYSWGGTSPSGFDCSGFVRFVFAHFGVSLTRTSFSQFGEGSSVSRSNLQPGDLVFFASNGGGASHVGIYVGNGQFINAADSGVRYDSLSSGYWSSSYVGGRRVLG
jgi:peptidoglycan endopeptidase LytE